MLAVVKTPLTDFSVKGNPIPADLLDDLRKKYGPANVVIDDSNDWIDVQDTDCYKEMQADYTPGAMLRFCRQEEHWTQKELAEKLGIDKHVISEMERGVRPVSLKMARALGKVFGHNYKNFLPES